VYFLLTILFLAFPAARAATIGFQVSPLTGAAERPTPAATAASGTATVTYDDVTQLLEVAIAFSNLSANLSAGHIHCCAGPEAAAGIAIGFVGLPASISGSYSQSFDLSSAAVYNAAFLGNNGGVSGARAALLAGMSSGNAYVNLHTSAFPAGEIRGNFVPEPYTYMMIGTGLVLFGIRGRRGPSSS
jgi:hypothetical protein